MNLFKFFEGIEELIYEIVIWIVFIPKTLLRIILHPAWIQSYINSEWGKPADERFSEFLSPVLFWAITAVLPSAWFITLFYVDPNLPPSANFFQLPQEGIFIPAILFIIGFPLIFALVLQKAKRLPIDRILLKRVFYIQCFCCCPPQLAFVAFVTSAYVWSVTPDTPIIYTQLCFLIWLAAILWFICTEIIVSKQELNVNLRKAIQITIIPLTIIIVLLLVLSTLAVQFGL